MGGSHLRRSSARDDDEVWLVAVAAIASCRVLLGSAAGTGTGALGVEECWRDAVGGIRKQGGLLLLRPGFAIRHTVNRGSTCRKARALPAAVIAPDRATVPLWRETRHDRWRERGWGEVTAELARRLRAIASEAGPAAIAFYVSGQLLPHAGTPGPFASA